MKAYIKHEPNSSTLARVCRVESYFNHVYYQITCKTGTCTSMRYQQNSNHPSINKTHGEVSL